MQRRPALHAVELTVYCFFSSHAVLLLNKYNTKKEKEKHTDFSSSFTSSIYGRLTAGRCTGSAASLGTCKRHEVCVFYQQMFEAPDEKLPTQGGMVGENSVQYPAGVD